MKFHKVTHSHTDTICFTQEEAAAWELPSFQRTVHENVKVLALAEHLKTNGGILPGTITFGILNDRTYLIDGQQRRRAFKLSGLKEGLVEACYKQFETMQDMAKEYIELNSHLVPMKPDNFIKGMEEWCEPIQIIRKKFPCVGYDNIRRGERSPILSMSSLLRCWSASGSVVPTMGGMSSTAVAEKTTVDDAHGICQFLKSALASWGKDPEYQRLWSNLNLCLCMWLFRRTVLGGYSARSVRLTEEEFASCLMALSADVKYVEWLRGRNLGEHGRGPCYGRIKEIWSDRITELRGGAKAVLPQPDWADHNRR
jgi:hypothetical protein